MVVTIDDFKKYMTLQRGRTLLQMLRKHGVVKTIQVKTHNDKLVFKSHVKLDDAISTVIKHMQNPHKNITRHIDFWRETLFELKRMEVEYNL